MSSTAMQSFRKIPSVLRLQRELSLEAFAKSFGQKAASNVYAADDFDSLLVCSITSFYYADIPIRTFPP